MEARTPTRNPAARRTGAPPTRGEGDRPSIVVRQAALQPGQLVDDRYSLEAALRGPGLGVVWRAGDTHHASRKVRVKLLDPRPALGDDEFVGAMRALQALRHPAVIAVVGQGVWRRRPFVVLDVGHDATVEDWLDELRAGSERPSLADVWRVFESVSLALHAAHTIADAEPIVHGGVVPNCIVVNRRGDDVVDAQVCDFTLAGFDEIGTERRGQLPGYTEYLAPEQLDAQRETPATDVFALAVVLMEMLTTQSTQARPWAEIARSGGVTDALGSARDDLPAAAWSVVAMALEANPMARHATAGAFLEALRPNWPGAPKGVKAVVAARAPTPAPAAPREAARPAKDAPPALSDARTSAAAPLFTDTPARPVFAPRPSAPSSPPTATSARASAVPVAPPARPAPAPAPAVRDASAIGTSRASAARPLLERSDAIRQTNAIGASRSAAQGPLFDDTASLTAPSRSPAPLDEEAGGVESPSDVTAEISTLLTHEGNAARGGDTQELDLAAVDDEPTGAVATVAPTIVGPAPTRPTELDGSERDRPTELVSTVPDVPRPPVAPVAFTPAIRLPFPSQVPPTPSSNTPTRTPFDSVFESLARVRQRVETDPRVRIGAVVASLVALVALGMLIAAVVSRPRIGRATPASSEPTGTRGSEPRVGGSAVSPHACSSGMVHIDAARYRPSASGGDENGETAVAVSELCVDRTEVTVSQYLACVTARGCAVDSVAVRSSAFEPVVLRALERFCTLGDLAHPQRPANCVDWMHALQYCTWRGGRLPTETEWEFVARGPHERPYPWGTDAPSPERVNGCGAECAALPVELGIRRALYPQADEWIATGDVGMEPDGASPFHVLDLAGNVWEWTADAIGTATPSTSDSLRAVRGGSWLDTDAATMRVTSHRVFRADTRLPQVGFRCVQAFDH